MSGRASWIKRKPLFRTPFYKRGPCGNYHRRWDRFCFCRVNEFSGDWSGGIYDFRTKRPYLPMVQTVPAVDPYMVDNERNS